jgi:hypothetical protein
MKRVFALSIAALILSVFSMQAAPNLKLNLEKGKEYKIKSTTSQTMSMTMNGAQMNTDVTSMNAIKFIPESLETDYILVRVSFDSIISNVNNPYKTVKINSNKPGSPKNPDDIMSNAMAVLVKNPLEVKLSYSGKILEVINLKAVFDTILKQLDSLPETAKGQMKMAVEMAFNLDMFKMMIESPINYLTGNPINQGDKWESKFTIKPNGMELLIGTKYKCKNIENNQAGLTGDVTIESPENAVMNMNGMQIPFDMRGMGTTDISVDLNTGWIIKCKTKQKMQGSMTFNGNAMPMEIESKTETEAVK